VGLRLKKRLLTVFSSLTPKEEALVGRRLDYLFKIETNKRERGKL
jgi:hypothetical protein